MFALSLPGLYSSSLAVDPVALRLVSDFFICSPVELWAWVGSWPGSSSHLRMPAAGYSAVGCLFCFP